MCFFILFWLGNIVLVTGWQCPDGKVIPEIYVKPGQQAIISVQTTLQAFDGQIMYSVAAFNNSNLYSATFYDNVLRNEKSFLESEFIGDASRGNFTVKTNGVQRQDGGVYMLQNKRGAADRYTELCAMLCVLGKPQRATMSNDNNNVLGKNSQLTCHSSSTTFPTNHTLQLTYNWKVNDVTNPSTTKYSYGDGRKTLTIISVNRGDSNNTFECSATESGNIVTGFTSDYSDKFVFTVIYGPDSSTTELAPSNTEYTLNEGVRLNNITCIGDCYPRCYFKWTKSCTIGASIVSNNAVLSLGTLSRAEAATYMCEVTNANTTVRTVRKQVEVHVNYGSDASTTKLTPSLITYTRNEGESLNDIQCSGRCYPSCNYKWTKSGSSTSVNNALLSLGSLDRTEAGTYTCTVSNPKTDKKQTKTVSVFVRYGPDACNISSDSPLTLTEGESSPTVSCESKCYPSCSHTWINMSSSILIGENGKFQLVKTTRYQTGNYKCSCRNTDTAHYVKNQTANLHIIIQYASLIIKGHERQKSVTVDEYDTDIQFHCKVNDQESRIQLLFKDVLLKEDHQSTVLTFTRSSITCSHAGVYTCKGSNKHAQAPSSSINLFVRCSPRPLQQIKQNTTSPLYVSASLTFTTIAYPEPGPKGFLWYKENGLSWMPLLSNNDLLVSSTRLQSTLTILNVSHSDYGRYKVTTTNNIGSYLEYLVLEREDIQRESDTPEPCKEGSNKTGTIVGICFGVLSAFLAVNAGYLTVLHKRRSTHTGKRGTEDLNAHVTYINIAEEGTVRQTNDSNESKDDPAKLYTELAQNSKDDNRTYDVIQKS